MPLADKDTGMVDALGESELEDLGLQPSLQEVFNLQAEDVIQLHLTLVEHTDSDQTPQQSISCNDSMKIQESPMVEEPQHKENTTRKPESKLTPCILFDMSWFRLASFTRNSWHHRKSEFWIL